MFIQMSDEHVRKQIRAAAESDAAAIAGLIGQMVSLCWPGGASDRTEPAALPWLRTWRPARGAAILPACSCRRGHCAICN